MDFICILLTATPSAVCMGQSLQKLFPPQPKRWKRWMLYFLLHVTFSLRSWVGDENPIILFPFFMLGFLILIPGDKLPPLVAGGIFYTLFISLNMLLDSFHRHELVIVIMLVIKMLLWCVLAWFLQRIVPDGGLWLSKQLWLMLGGLTLAPLVATLSFSLRGYRFVDGWQFDFYSDVLHRLGFTVLPFVLISVLTLLIAAAVLSRHEALAQENRLAALREVYYTGLQQEQIQLRTLRHDLCNHVTALQGLLEQGREGDAVRYLAELSDSPALGSGKRYTANETANVVLASKAAIMAAAGLVADFSVWVPARLSIPAPELCALLGNALDNAIEGAANAKNRVVCLRLRVEKGLFMLQVQNAVGGTIMPDLSTTKPNGERHGLGLAGMRDIVRRHSGTLETTIENGQFELMVCFPCNEP